MSPLPKRRVDYHEYIQSEQWRSKASEAKRRAENRCQICYRKAGEVTLDAHHRTYERLGDERPDDITVLCRECHELYETNKKLPKSPVSYPIYRTSPPPSASSSTNYPSTPGKEVSLIRKEKRELPEGLGSFLYIVAFLAIILAATTVLTECGGSGAGPTTETPTPTLTPTGTPSLTSTATGSRHLHQRQREHQSRQ